MFVIFRLLCILRGSRRYGGLACSCELQAFLDKGDDLSLLTFSLQKRLSVPRALPAGDELWT